MESNICVDGLKKIMHGTISLSYEILANNCRLRSTKLILVMCGSRQF